MEMLYSSVVIVIVSLPRGSNHAFFMWPWTVQPKYFRDKQL